MIDVTDDTTKRCTVCGRVKPLDEFHRSRTSKSGRMGICAPCRGLDRSRSRNRARNTEQSERAQLRHERATTARRAEDDEAWIAEGWALLRASRDEASG